ncbi:hypothetical protein QTH97_33530 [Variovorax sp. J22R24]|uniref:esterase/lipase family protein n=1 Tax=Variovorax gracilis TaxID=3053502 RepID=UPI0025767DD7|nr:hypothetical protein [Variovorax sp. J22R24]MDM0109875.1 hypothetical protein [Variovorax sp. J22R24]
MNEVQNGFALPLKAKGVDPEKLRLLCVLPDAGVLLRQVAKAEVPAVVLDQLIGSNGPMLGDLAGFWDQQLQKAETLTEMQALFQRDEPTGALSLFAALRMVSQDQRNETDKDLLEWTLYLRDPAADGDVVLEHQAPLFLLMPGSLTALLLDAAKGAGTTLAKWGIGIALGLAGREFADVLERARAREAKLSSSTLRRFEDLPGDEACKVLTVFVHGLFSMDVGLFDPLVACMRSLDASGVRCVGFPHNPLLSIDENARTLSDAIRIQMPSRVVFLCHHRGGLVARKAALMLYERDAPRWRDRLLGGLTFGTPHLGLSYADSPSRVLGSAYVVCRPLDASAWPPGFLNKSDLLMLVTAMRGIPPALAELQPPTSSAMHAGAARYLDGLIRAERLAEAELQCRLRLYAVGGNDYVPPPQRLIVGKLLASSPNDGLVAQRSSAPDNAGPGTTALETEDEHRTYFNSDTLNAVLKVMREWLDQAADEDAKRATTLQAPTSRIKKLSLLPDELRGLAPRAKPESSKGP